MFEVWYNYLRPNHAWVNHDPAVGHTAGGHCPHCATTHAGDPASAPACTAREGRMIVDGRTSEEAESYVRECAGPSELEHWSVRPEKPVKLWVGAQVRHNGLFVCDRASIAEAKKYVEAEAARPLAVLVGDNPVRRAASEADARAMASQIEGSRVAPHVSRTNDGHIHKRADLPAHHAVDVWSVHPGQVIAKFDTVEEAEAYRDQLVAHGREAARFTITG